MRAKTLINYSSTDTCDSDDPFLMHENFKIDKGGAERFGFKFSEFKKISYSVDLIWNSNFHISTVA